MGFGAKFRDEGVHVGEAVIGLFGHATFDDSLESVGDAGPHVEHVGHRVVHDFVKAGGGVFGLKCGLAGKQFEQKGG